jgi:uncharacterized protein YjcR
VAKLQRKVKVPDERTVARDAQIRELYEQGMTIYQVAEVLGVSPVTVWHSLAKAGVVRERGWRQRQEREQLRQAT